MPCLRHVRACPCGIGLLATESLLRPKPQVRVKSSAEEVNSSAGEVNSSAGEVNSQVRVKRNTSQPTRP
eukprot:7215270-Pyramimonas_sp.AAC.1